MGEGKNLEEAKNDLIRTIIELRTFYSRIPLENLDARAVQFREYLLGVLNV